MPTYQIHYEDEEPYASRNTYYEHKPTVKPYLSLYRRVEHLEQEIVKLNTKIQELEKNLVKEWIKEEFKEIFEYINKGRNV